MLPPPEPPPGAPQLPQAPSPPSARTPPLAQTAASGTTARVRAVRSASTSARSTLVRTSGEICGARPAAIDQALDHEASRRRELEGSAAKRVDRHAVLDQHVVELEDRDATHGGPEDGCAGTTEHQCGRIGGIRSRSGDEVRGG